MVKELYEFTSIVACNHTHNSQAHTFGILQRTRTESYIRFQTVADVIRTCLGPRAMLKMLMDPMGGICMTNDGNAILREITVQHPAAKSLIEIARTQDEETGDGTTSVIILGEVLLTPDCAIHEVPFSMRVNRVPSRKQPIGLLAISMENEPIFPIGYKIRKIQKWC